MGASGIGAGGIGEPQVTEQAQDLARAPVGVLLRTKREQLGWSLPDVAAWLRIRLSYLESLESGQVAKLPGNAYAMGFLRAYSGALGLDAEDMARRFRTETKDVTRKPELSFPVPVPERGVPAGAIVLLGVVVVVCAYVGWYEFTGHLTRETHSVPPVPQALLPYAGAGAPTASPQVATVMPGPGQTPSPLPPADPSRNAAQPAPAGTPSAETAGVPAETQTEARPVQVPTSTTPPGAAPATAGLAANEAPPAAPGATPTAAPATSGQITLNAVARSWVQVRQADGKVLYDHILEPGESWTVPAGSSGLMLTTGNAGGVTLSADGVTSAPLGKVGAVRRAIPLDSRTIRDGSVTGGATPASEPAVASPGVPAPPASAPTASAPPASAPTASVSGTTPDATAGATSGVAAAPSTPAVRRHRAAPATPPSESDETDRLNRAQLKNPPPP